ncbi:hypothetical protein MUJ63_10520 [Lachnospiraceae bacterium NSJ-143]|nr:hypothetical protein [Lachnospiraceae bacterium NSJ-143]
MILGYDTFTGNIVDTPQIPLQRINSIEASNCIIDELHVRNAVMDIIEKGSYDDMTILKAEFNGDMEAGSITMRENQIVKLRVKRREAGNTYFRTVAEFELDNDEQILTKAFTFKDYEPRSNVTYEWAVTPVDSSGIEGNLTSTTSKIKFDGWWVIDLDNPEEYSLQFVFNMDSVNISTEEDREVLSTFARYGFVRYGAKYAKSMTLKWLFMENDGFYPTETWRQVERLDKMKLMHKSFLVKSGNGKRFIGDIHSPQETTYEAIRQIEDIQIEVYEVGEIND